MRCLIILYVEDRHEDVSLLARACDAAGLPADFHEVPDGTKAISYLKGEGEFADRSRHPLPQVVVLDWKLSGMSGLAFLQWLRQEPKFSLLPVLVFTEFANAEDKARALAEGANGYFAKPPDYEALVRLAESFRRFAEPNSP